MPQQGEQTDQDPLITNHDNINDINSSIQTAEEYVTDRDEADNAPKDHWMICHFAFFVIGICQLLPWNFLLNATNVSEYRITSFMIVT